MFFELENQDISFFVKGQTPLEGILKCSILTGSTKLCWCFPTAIYCSMAVLGQTAVIAMGEDQ